mgnify:FL=1
MTQSCYKIEYRNKNAINYDKIDIARNINKKNNKYNLNYKIMKKFRVLSSVLASVLMMTVMSCSSSDDLNGGGADANDKSYLAIRINNVGSVAGSRAASDYSDGTADENHIESVRFYFFNSDGSPYILKKDGQSTGKNWLEKTETDDLNTGDKQNPNVSMISNPLLVIEGNTGASPAVMIAVINPNSLDGNKLGDGAKTLDDVKRTSIFSQFYATGNKDFVMSNSVYVANGVEKCASIVTGFVATTADAAKAKPVDLFVERVVAKVQPTIDATYTATDGRKWIKIDGKDAMKVGVYGNNDIYAVVDGWGVADENGKAELVKQVNTAWNDENLGISVWTSPDYHRCFWTSSVAFAAGSNAEGNAPVNHSYNDFAGRKLTDCAYTLPNAPTSVNADPYASTLTKMVLAAHLVYKDGEDYKTAEICQYRGQEYLHIADVKTEVANNFADYYIKKGDTRTKLQPSDIDFTAKADGIRDYQVVATLRKLAGDETLQQKTGTTEDASSFKDVKIADLQKMMNAEPAQIRKDGKAYYFIPIRHLGTDPTKLGYYGIVRNHVYSINIQNMSGFGTPVYDPDKTIDPTIPSNDATYLAARINVLSWRVVKYNADLDKTK